MVVGALIFVLGIDLVKEALWDTRHRSSWSEYLTIVSIVVCMTLWDFVVGVLFGIVICCKYGLWLHIDSTNRNVIWIIRLLFRCTKFEEEGHPFDVFG